jgi:Spermine/spermidine synthase domain
MATSDIAPRKRNLAMELFIISATSLFFELLVIRWFGCDFRTFAVFKTFPLVGCFIGLGVGVSQADDRLFRHAPIALLAFVIIVKFMTEIGFGNMSFPAAGLYQWINYSALFGAQLGLHVFGMMMALALLLAGPFGVMICIGARIGALFNAQKPLNAYCLDIGGAITGSIIFALLSFLWISPYVQVCILAAFLLIFTLKETKPKWLAPAALIAAALLALVPTGGGFETLWTPYYKIEKLDINAAPNMVAQGGNGTNLLGIYVNVNHGFQQAFTPNNDIRMTEEGRKQPALKTLEDFFQVRNHYYNLPYSIIKPKEILVLGAGSGSDVNQAVKNGVQSITGVEIDPGVLSLGQRYNASYQSPNVHLRLEDGRHFVNQCDKKYDMIVFACLDSLALSGIGSSVRTDSYIHTVQSYRKCLSLLNPDGLLILSFGASVNGGSDWLRDRIYGTLTEAAGYPPIFMTDDHAPHKWPAYVFISGNPVKEGKISPPSDPNSFSVVKMPATVNTKILTDDWPYLYIRPLGIDVPYMLVLIEIILITLFAGRQLLFSKLSVPSDWQLLFMGAAFMLLELQSISRLSLAYGSTWVTSSVVINGVLIMILLANVIVLKMGNIKRQEILYAFLMASILVNYFLPVEKMLSWGDSGLSVGHIALTILTLIPMFIAGLIFASAFSQVSTPARSFSFNLIGSVLGALLEYISTYFGQNSLLLVTIVLYAVSLFYYFQVKPAKPPEISEPQAAS